MSAPTVWIPASAPYTPFEVTVRPLAGLGRLSLQEWDTLQVLTAAERRLYVPGFVDVFRWEAFRAHLPLQVAPLPDVPSWPRRRCRSY
jgi:hypothetical protein